MVRDLYSCIVMQVWEGLGVVETGRKMLGTTDPVHLCVFVRE